MTNVIDSYAGKLKDSLYWWLGKRRPFIVNDQYKIELLYIDRDHNSVKIRVTNLHSMDEVESSLFQGERNGFDSL